MAGQRNAAFFGFLVAMAASLAILSGGASAKTFNVGDDDKWNLNVNYTKWAAQYDFAVGDVLHFEYTAGAHTVLPLPSKESFAACDFSAANASSLMQGGSNDVVLKTPGTKWYVCNVGQHCLKGMKLKITVSAAAAEELALPPSNPQAGSASTLRGSALALAAGALVSAAASLFV